MKRRLLFLCALAVTCTAAPLASSAQTTFAGVVTTFAGSGKLGMADGARAQASFILPAGLAVARDGTDRISANLAFRHVDAIVPGRANGLSPALQPPSLALFEKSVADLLDTIAPSKAHLIVLWQCYDSALFDREELRSTELMPEANGNVSTDEYLDTQRSLETAVFESLKGLKVTQCDSFDASIAYEKADGPLFFLPDNAHYTDRGNLFFGTVPGDCLAYTLAAGK